MTTKAKHCKATRSSDVRDLWAEREFAAENGHALDMGTRQAHRESGATPVPAYRSVSYIAGVERLSEENTQVVL